MVLWRPARPLGGERLADPVSEHERIGTLERPRRGEETVFGRGVGVFSARGGGAVAAAGGGGAPESGGVRAARGGAGMTSVSRHERISGQLVDLKMPGALEALDEVIRRVDSGSLSGSEAIEQLLGAQIALRPSLKRLADFDFTFPIELDFLRRKENVVFPGVGKTHLAISLAAGVPQLRRRLRVLTHPLDVVLPATTSTRSEEWGTRGRGDGGGALDRLLHHCHIVNIRGNSYRMRQRGDLAQALRQVPARKNPEQGPATPAEVPR